MQAYTYLLVNFFTIVICFIFSFDHRIQFNKHFGAFLKAIIVVMIPFVLWDVWFTYMGVWWFDYSYTIGLSIAGLPLEEWLFFICIPFSCLFTYFFIDKYFPLKWTYKLNAIIVWTSILVCIFVAITFHERIYPFVTAIITALTLFYLHLIAKVDWIGKASFVYLILMLGFFPVNGILTGTGLESPIVNYNPEEILNIRVFTIPIEDFVYGYAQFLLNLYFFKRFKNKEIDA